MPASTTRSTTDCAEAAGTAMAAIVSVSRIAERASRLLRLFAAADQPWASASGRAGARHVTDRPSLELDFVKAARHRRGLVAWVEKPGRIEAGEGVEARLPEQWIYASEPSAS